MNLQLQHKVIIVTGGSRGIGAAVTKVLSEEGAVPFVFDITATAGLSVQVDLTDAEACRTAVAAVLEQCGRIDGVVNNAGLNDGVGLEAGSAAGFLRSLDSNAGHYYHVAQLALEALKTSGGNIVNIISKVAETGQGNTSGYAAANGVRAQLTRDWAVELAPLGIRVNGVVVAECRTPQYTEWISSLDNGEDRLRSIEALIPLERRLTEPDEIANTVAFLLSPLSSGLNGELMHVDGGYVHLDRQG